VGAVEAAVSAAKKAGFPRCRRHACHYSYYFSEITPAKRKSRGEERFPDLGIPD
jgi:hypothetical protein